MNAYMLFSQSIRSEVKDQNPDFTMGEIVSETCNYRANSCSNILSLTCFDHSLAHLCSSG